MTAHDVRPIQVPATPAPSTVQGNISDESSGEACTASAGDTMAQFQYSSQMLESRMRVKSDMKIPLGGMAKDLRDSDLAASVCS